MEVFSCGGSENLKEPVKAGPAPRKMDNAAFAVGSKPSFVTAGLQHVQWPRRDVSTGRFDHFHIHMYF